MQLKDRLVADPIVVSEPLAESVANIIDLAASGLSQMFDPEKQLFCHVLRRSGGRLVQIGTSRRYTMMTLLGLHRLERSGVASPVAIKPVVEFLTSNLGWVDNIGDLGLLFWLVAIIDPDRLKGLLSRASLSNALSRFEDARCQSTTELAWLLSGLAHAKLTSPSIGQEVDELATTTYTILRQNQGNYGLFAHLGSTMSWKGRLRGRIGTFADQVYPIYAFSQFGRAFESCEALKSAQHCAETIAALQGPSGEWWWHYDSECGRVTRGYPVYSVHQHGMAPMALLSLSEVTDFDSRDLIVRGLRWIAGMNIMNFDMRDKRSCVIWRNIDAVGRFAQLKELGYLVSPYEITPGKVSPRITYECRPYELGWALYALVPVR